VLTQWAANYLAKASDRSLQAMLDASVLRTYSGAPESFFTGGGVQGFGNFDSDENGGSYTVIDAFKHSVNLSFVRILRDIANYYTAENGIDAEKDRAAVLEVDRASGQWRVFASGLRNPNGPAWNPKTGELWVVVNERDELGNDLVPDYMTSVKDGAFYGWPYSYYGDHVDTRVEPRRPDLVQKAMAPDYALGAHTASLGLAFNTGNLFPPETEGGAFIGQHGSWNRKPRAGYKVIFVPFKDGKPSGPPQDVLTGFLNDKGEAQGRPVGLRLDKQGALLVADDVGNTIWRVTPSAKSASR